MNEIEKAIAYFEDAVKESDEIINDCTDALKVELTEQKQHFVAALEVMRRTAPENKLDTAGLHVKYDVRKISDGSLVNNCFVLRPDKDPAAVAALRAYAADTENKALAEDIYNWIGRTAPENKPLTHCVECTNYRPYGDKGRGKCLYYDYKFDVGDNHFCGYAVPKVRKPEQEEKKNG